MVVDDHVLFRQGITSLIHMNPGYEVIGEAGNGKDALSFLTDYQPDIVLLDINMPVMNGRETLTEINKLYPDIKVIMLTMYNDKIHETDYMQLGAHSFLSKETDIEEVLKAINSVINHRYFYSSSLQDVQSEIICNKQFQISLNDIETKIVKLLCNNKTNTYISKALKININTIRYYRRTIYAKTLTKSIADLVKYAIKNGIISSEIEFK